MLETLQGILSEIWMLWREMALYLLFGFGMAGILSRLLKRDAISRHLGENNMASVAKASLFGIPLPLCSCSVIPVGLSLFQRGASRGATTSFLISTPQTGVDSLAITYAFLGPVFMIVRPVAAFINGMLGGGLVTFLTRDEPHAKIEVPEEERHCEDAACTGPNDPIHSVPLRTHIVEAFRYGFIEFPREVAGLMVIGIIIAGALAYIMPDGFLHRYLGQGIFPMLVMAVAGIPLYICATASVPVVAVLVAKGLSPGAALVFLMTGPATNMATIVLLSRTLGLRSILSYIGSIFVTSMVAGFSIDWYFTHSAEPFQLLQVAQEHSVIGGWATQFGAWAMMLIFLAVFVQRFQSRQRQRADRLAQAASTDDAQLELKVEGMTCGGCVEKVRSAITRIEGVDRAMVDLEAGQVRIFGKSFDKQQPGQAVREAGFTVVE